MPRTSTPPTVDQATVELLETQHRHLAGTATAEEVLAAEDALAAARRHQAELDRVHTRRAEIEADAKNLADAQAAADWLDGPEHLELHLAAVEAYRQAVDAHVAFLGSWKALGAARQQRFRQLRRLAHNGPLPDGVSVDDRVARECFVSTPRGSWDSQALYFDTTPYVVDRARDIVSGRPPRVDLAALLDRKYGAGIGAPLLPPPDEEEGAA